MSMQPQILIFGEVLFDCFPSGEQVLGGAPFNVAWHLQALGDQPRFVSRVGDDEAGRKILHAMSDWGLNISSIQVDMENQTGRVEVKVINNEPHYDITPNCAYDFIDASKITPLPAQGILYHGTLGLRNKVSRDAFSNFLQSPDLSIFLDVNLRTPWWQKDEIYNWMEQARWVKLNLDELRLLGFADANINQVMSEVQDRFKLEQLIVTRGEQGTIVLSKQGEFHNLIPEKISQFVDTVGAGDAFSAIYIHGLMLDWPVSNILKVAQEFAAKVIGLRGATSTDPDFYQAFIN